ncbi:hypothetical protein U9M48_018580 [Paspalum notatum var. saurae]|uniref:Acidic protein n=1 Tax=Paspalum notatum var. saurae TaxID=547442 RepID=A0AAQ3TDV6_PASNO
MAGGRHRLAVVAAAAAAVLAVAGGGSYASAPADDDCFANCFKKCVGGDKSMTDYCNYACGMTCGSPDYDDARALQLGGAPTNCQLACVRTACRGGLRRRQGNAADGKEMVACYGQCSDSCEAKKQAGVPRPTLRAGTGGEGAARRSSAALADKPFRKTQDDAAVEPAGEPDPDDAIRPAMGPRPPVRP